MYESAVQLYEIIWNWEKTFYLIRVCVENLRIFAGQIQSCLIFDFKVTI